jgi:hypothetical protein
VSERRRFVAGGGPYAENLAAIFIIPSSWGSQLDGEKLSTPYRIKLFSGVIAGEEEEDFCKGSFCMHILYFVYCFALLYFTCIVLSKNKKKIESFVVVFTCLLLVLLE